MISSFVRARPLGTAANTDTKLLIYGLFQKGRVLAQDGLSEQRKRAQRVRSAANLRARVPLYGLSPDQGFVENLLAIVHEVLVSSTVLSQSISDRCDFRLRAIGPS